MPEISVVNESSLVAAEVRLMARACNLQLRRDCAPLWERSAWPVRYRPSEDAAPADSIPIVIFDTSDDPKDLAYHWETPGGKRYGRVFVDPILKRGGSIRGGANSVSGALSHEVLEAFIDPDCNLWAETGYDTLVAYEICDPVQSRSYRIKVTSKFVHVSNFVLPGWFDFENPKDARFDYLRRLKKPFEILAGGYYMEWTDDGIEEYSYRFPEWKRESKRHVAARTARRRVGNKKL